MEQAHLFQPDRTIYNSDEVAALGFHSSTTPPEPTVCPFCGGRLCFEAVVLYGAVMVWRRNQPERCTCPESVAFWAEEDAREEREIQEAALREERDRERERIQRLLGSSGLKNRFTGRTFEAFQQRPDNARALAIAKRYASQFETYQARGYGIYFEGPCGTGKTHLAAAIALQLIARGVPVLFCTAGDLLRQLRRSYDTDATFREDQIMRVYTDTELLIIDDLGKERCTEWTVDRLYSILNERYEQLRPVIITTNYSQNELLRRLTPPGGDSKTAEAIISRLQECTGAVALTGPDHRRGKETGHVSM